LFNVLKEKPAQSFPQRVNSDSAFLQAIEVGMPKVRCFGRIAFLEGAIALFEASVFDDVLAKLEKDILVAS
jgi:hypothetical protein